MHKLAAWAVMILVIAVPISREEAMERLLRFDFSGSIVTTAVDSNQDGIPAGLASVQGNGVLGPITLEALVEWASTDLNKEDCPTADLQGTLVAGHAVARLKNGDLIFMQSQSGTLCLESPNLANFRLRGEIIGGTGRFANARGDFETDAHGTALIFAPDGSHGFGGVTGEARATITTR